MLKLIRKLLIEESGATAVEFALSIGIFLVAVFSAIDLSLYSYGVNRQQAATYAAARFAITSPPIAAGLSQIDVTGVAAGFPVPSERVPDFRCAGAGASSFTCTPGSTVSAPASALLGRIQAVMPEVQARNVTVSYVHVGLGLVGNPVGTNTDPLVSVEISGVEFRPVILSAFTPVAITLPPTKVSLLAEDLK